MESLSHSRISPPPSSQGTAGLSLPSGKMRNCSVGSVNSSAESSPVSESPVHALLIARAPVQKEQGAGATAGTQPPVGWRHNSRAPQAGKRAQFGTEKAEGC